MRAPLVKPLSQTVIRVENIYSQLITNDRETFESLRNSFSFQDKRTTYLLTKRLGIRPKPRYVSFIDKTGYFGTGLLPEIQLFLRQKDHPFQIEDQRLQIVGVPNTFEVTPDILQTPTNQTIKLHYFQTEVANLALKEQRGIIKCATGGGKTLIFTAMLKAMKNKYSAMVLMRSKTLVEQTYEVFRQCGLESIGRVNGDYFEPSHITVATVQSLHKINDLIPKTKVLILDEVHEFTSKLSIEILQKFENTLFRWGFSATPFKSGDPVHNYKLKSWIGPQLCDITTEQLQESKVLCDSEAHFWLVDEPKNIMDIDWPDAEEVGIVKNTFFHKQVAQLVNQIQSGRILVLVKRLQHGDALHELLPGSYWVRGQDDSATREYVFSQLRQSDKPKVVAICSSIGFVGLNIYCHHLINAAGGRSPNLIIQKIGRGLRKAKDKQKLEYHDFFFRNNIHLQKHSEIRISTLRKEGHKDYLLLVQEWPETFCEIDHCNVPQGINWFTIHGMWPTRIDGSWPSDCPFAPKFVENNITDLIPVLNKYWPSLTGPSLEFWAHEWNTHGTCAARLRQLNTEHAFFSFVTTTAQRSNLIGILKGAGIVPSQGQTYSLNQIKHAVSRALGSSPSLECSHQHLWRIELCINTQLQLIDCESVNKDDRNCPSSGIVIPPIRNGMFHH